MTVQISPPPRNPRSRGTALASYYDLDTSPVFGADPVGTRWALDGVTFVPYGCVFPVQPLDPDICAADDAEDDAQGFDDAVTFPPFEWQVSISCTALSMTGDDLRKQLNVLLENELSRIFAEQVMSGVFNPNAPSLVSEAADVSQAGMADVKEAVAAAEDGLADRWGNSVGMIHVTPSTLFQIAALLTFEDGRWKTPSGHVVVADAGYQGGAPASGAVTAGDQWVYGSSPVHYAYRTLAWHGLDYENFDFERDIQTVRADGIGIAVFEPCSVVTAKVDNTP